MKNIFPGHFRESKSDLKKIWGECVFVFDANIILNFYRYSDETRREFFSILQEIKGRVWIPHRAAEEYLNNRLPVIGKQEKSYDETLGLMSNLESNLKNARQHPFVSEGVMKEVESVFSSLKEELEGNKSIHTKRIASDGIKDSVADIFEGRVGDAYGKEKIEEIISDGEERYKQRIPPGYKDAGKGGDSERFDDKCKKYGDLIVWRQVLDYASENDRDIVLVIDDKKEDWWEKFEGKTIGPRPELVKEFKGKSEKSFHMYQADRFLELARENLGKRVSAGVVEEIREVRRRDAMANKKRRKEEVNNDWAKEVEELRLMRKERESHLSFVNEELKSMSEKQDSLISEISSLRSYREGFNGEESGFDYIDFRKRYISLMQDYEAINNTVKSVVHKKNMLEFELHKIDEDLKNRSYYHD